MGVQVILGPVTLAAGGVVAALDEEPANVIHPVATHVAVGERQRLLAASERVRRDIATQLRDGLQSKLLNLKGELQKLSEGISSEAETARVVNEVIDGLDQVIKMQLSTLVRKLYPSTLSHGLIPTFRSFHDRFGADLALEIDLDEALIQEEMAGSKPVSERVKLAAYRIAEEALTNVVQHAAADRVTVRLDAPREGWLRLSVRDDGQGFDMECAPRGLGLATMQDYAGAVDGECKIQSVSGGGTEVTAVLPLLKPRSVPLGTPEKGDN